MSAWGIVFSSINSFRTTNGINWVYSQLAGGGDNNSEVKILILLEKENGR